MVDEAWDRFVSEAEAAIDSQKDFEPLYALWVYQTQTDNGGHHAFFWNWNDQPQVFGAALRGAPDIGHDGVGDLMENAARIWNSKRRETPANVLRYTESARVGEFDELDDIYDDLQASFRVKIEAAVSQREVD